jgi:uncharacterized protein YbaA (DUF1428 family)
MAEPKLQGFPLNYTKACSSRREKLALFNIKSMRWPLFSVNYLAHAARVAALFREFGALRVVETWGGDVPEGKVTSFTLAVQRAEDETVVFSWVEWPSKDQRDAGWQAMMQDPRMAEAGEMPFDGKRMIYGGFQMIMDQ